MTQTLIPRLARIAWAVIVLVSLITFVAGVPHYFAQMRTPCAGSGCVRLQLAPEEHALLASLGASPDAYAAFQVALVALGAVVYVAIAALIVWRTASGIGFFTALSLALMGGGYLAKTPLALLEADPRWRPVVYALYGVGLTSLLMQFYVFPDGRFVPRWSAWMTVPVAITALVVGLNATSLAGAASASPAALVLILVAVGVACQVHRYARSSGPIERQQTKWVVAGWVGFMLCVFLWILPINLFPLAPGTTRVAYFTLGMGVINTLVVLLPVSFAVAILRYRLWDVDVIINRALVYAALTAALGATYLAGVVLLQAALSPLTQGSELSVAASTLLVAALFTPLRRRIQTAVDRRFFRHKYDAARTLAAFARRLRDEVELEPLRADLLAVVGQTVQPARASLWLRRATEVRR
jgi:hypothetical protein